RTVRASGTLFTGPWHGSGRDCRGHHLLMSSPAPGSAGWPPSKPPLPTNGISSSAQPDLIIDQLQARRPAPCPFPEHQIGVARPGSLGKTADEQAVIASCNQDARQTLGACLACLDHLVAPGGICQ